MQDLEHLNHKKQFLLDEIVSLAQNATERIDTLKQRNAELAAELASLKKLAALQRAENDQRQQKLTELEKTVAAASSATAWCQWFERKYSNSIFYMDMQRSFQNEQATSIPLQKQAQTEEA